MADRSTKDKEMAAYLKKIKDKRMTGKCAICNNLVSLKSMYAHIISCKGRH